MKAEKTLMIEEVLRKVNASPFLFVADYTGLTVDKFAELRKRLRACDAEIHVFKNNLVKKAAERAGLPDGLGDGLVGQIPAVIISVAAMALFWILQASRLWQICLPAKCFWPPSWVFFKHRLPNWSAPSTSPPPPWHVFFKRRPTKEPNFGWMGPPHPASYLIRNCFSTL